MRAKHNRRSISAAMRPAQTRSFRPASTIRIHVASGSRLRVVSRRARRRPSVSPETYASEFAELQKFIDSLPNHRVEASLPPLTDEELYEASRQ